MFVRTDSKIEKVGEGWEEFFKDHIKNKTAESVPELCDEFVLTRKIDRQVCMLRNYDLKDLSSLVERTKKTGDTLTGSIWVPLVLSDGRVCFILRPVAVLNQEGSWDLI